MKKSLSISIVIIITAALFSACGTGARQIVKPQPVKKPEQPSIQFTATDVAPKMKIFGTGRNFYGVVSQSRTPSGAEGWQSAGNPPHWLVFDGKGDFEGMAFKGLFNISRINIYIKKGEQYLDKIILTNINATNGNVQTRFIASPSQSTNLISATRFKIEFEGTNVTVSNIIIYGMLSKDKDYTIAKEYKYSEEIKNILHKSSQMFGKKKYKEAVSLNESAIKADPENPYPYMNLGQVWQASAEAMESHENYMENMDRSLENYESAERSDNPERVALIDRMIRLYWDNLIDPEKAVKYEEELLKIKQANNSNFSGKDLAKSYLSLAEKYGMGFNKIKNNNERIKMSQLIHSYYEKGADYVKNNPINPNNNGFAEPLYRLNLSYFGTAKQYEKAVELSKVMIEKLPETEVVKEGWVYENLGVANMALGRWQDAIEAWKGFVNHLGGGKTNPYLILSYCYLKNNDSFNAYISYVINLFTSLDYKSEIKPIRLEINKLENLPDVFRQSDSGKYNLVDIDFKYYEKYKEAVLKKYKLEEQLTKNELNKINDEVSKYLKQYNIILKK